MNYSKIQKIISFIVLFSFFFTSVFSFPNFRFFSKTSAASGDFYNLVSLLVDEEIYSQIKDEVYQYAEDIQQNLENTRVVILPIPEESTAFQVASINESLYFDGYKGLKSNIDFNSRLVGTILIGNIVLPTINDSNSSTLSIAPYVDFEDKAFIYDYLSKSYLKNKSAENKFHPEIWHGVISPNTGVKNKDIEKLKDFFEKDHDFYIGEGLFKKSDRVLNGNKNEELDDNYEPFVFYYDQFREEKSVHYPAYKGYEAYLKNKEDLMYNRYSKDLSNRIKNQVLGAENDEFDELLSKINDDKINDLFKKGEENGLSLDDAPDVSTIMVAQKSIKRFVEIFNKGTFSDFRTNVHNAGRYNKKTSKVNMDTIPYIITLLDTVSQEVVKEANSDVEKQIDDLVVNNLAKNIKVYYGREGSSSYTGGSLGSYYTGFRTIKSVNYYAGTKAEDLNTAADCTIFRGSTYNSGQLVEANRGLDILKAENDGQSRFFYKDTEIQLDQSKCRANTKGIYAGSSPLELNDDVSQGIKFELKSHDLNKAILPIFDIRGSKKVTDVSKNPSPKDCLNTNFIKTYEHEETSGEAGGWCVVHYKVLSNSGEGLCFSNSWNCDSDNVYYNGGRLTGSKEIPSYIMHKSPTKEELEQEINAKITPNLPVDRDRYIDFFSKPVDSLSKAGADSYQKIIYPNFYRISGENREEISEKLDKLLDDKSEEINAIGGATIDLKKELKDKPLKTLNLGGYEKEISYYDFLVFSIYWNNLKNVSSKYKFVIQNYLSDQFGGNDEKFALPKNKSEYEIAYLGAIGDAKNMYIKLDPNEKKSKNPYTNILGLNSILDSRIYGLRLLPNTNQVGVLADKSFDDGEFECAPPEGVPLWEWIPAVICRLKNMLPPKIGISDGECGVALESDGDESPFDEEEDQERQDFLDAIDGIEDEECYDDVNENGINDCLELKLDYSKLDMSTDSSRYYYGSHGTLNVIIKDKDDNRIYIDNSTTVHFRVNKIIDKESNDVVFDSNNEKYERKKYKDYIKFGEFGIRSRAGKAKYTFSVGHKDSDVYLSTFLTLKDRKTGIEHLLIEADPIKIEVRGDRMFLTSSNKIEGDLEVGGNYAVANDVNNLFIFDSNIGNFSDYSDLLNNGDLVFGLTNINKKGENIDYEYPLDIRITDNNNNNIFETSIANLSGLKSLLALEKSGEYKLYITDSKGFSVKKSFEIKATEPSKLSLQLGSNILEKGGSISTNYVLIQDRFDNPVIGRIFDIDLNISGNSVVFNVNNDKKLNLTTIEGYRAFRLKTTDNEGISNLKVTLKEYDNVLLDSNKDIKVLGDVSLQVIPKSNLKVGGNKTLFDLKVVDKNNNLVSDLNSRVYVQVDKKYGVTTKPYFDIINGEAEIEFITSKLAGENILFKFQVEGFKTFFTKQFTILPLNPLKIQILPSKTKFEASVDSYTTLKVELRDVYGNVVFNDNSTSLNLFISDEDKEIINSDVQVKTVTKGVVKFKINATNIPGKAYVKISSNPDLSNNYFEIEGQSPFSKDELNSFPEFRQDGILTSLGKKFFYEIDEDNYRFKFSTIKKLTRSSSFKSLGTDLQNRVIELFNDNNIYRINGVGANVIGLETFFFWNAEKINGRKYNSLYSVLLGAEYGDVTKKDYLASGILFDKNNRGLAVTSLIANPYNFNDILNLETSGAFKKLVNSSDLSQNISFDFVAGGNKSYISLFNSNLGIDIGKIYFNFSNDTNLDICNSISTCDLSGDKTSIFGVDLNNGYKYEKNNDDLVLKDTYGNELFSISKTGKIKLNSNIDFKISKKSFDGLLLDIELNGKYIGNLIFKFNDSNIKATRENLILNGLLHTNYNSIIIKLNTELYGIRDVYKKDNNRKIAIYYKDPFEKKNSLNSFAKGSYDNFENFINKEGIGWKEKNKSLLSFSAGKSVGESIKDFQSLLVVNLGDPVISLKKKKIKKVYGDGYKKFDRTIGKKVNKFDIESVKIFDYNADGKDDLLFIKNDKYFSLLENQDISGNFIDLKNLVRVEDIGDLKQVQTGDFTGDGYDDIFFINNKGNPFILNNNLKDFLRFDLTKQFDLNAKVTIARAFDMDHDGIDDIVTLDDDGKINIFYGTSDHIEPTFTKKEVYDGYGIKLSDNIRNDYGLVYFDEVPQLSIGESNSEAILSAEEFNRKMSLNAEKVAELTEKINTTTDEAERNAYIEELNNLKSGLDIYSEDNAVINEGLLNSLIYVQVPYGDVDSGNLENVIEIDEDSELAGSLGNTQELLEDFVDEYGDYVGDIQTNQTKQTTFIRSQYSEALGVKVEKQFKDRNGGNLKSGDIVNVTVKLKNITSHNINNLVYIEDFPLNFIILEDSINNNQNLDYKQPQDFGKILFEGINLSPGEEFELTYNLKTKKFKFGFIEVGLFEKGELGDDLYGDIIFKKNENVCADTVDLFRSIGVRSYEKGIKQPDCDPEKLEPKIVSENADNDNNGIPDYIDELLEKSEQGDIDALKEYAEEKGDELDTDSDGDGLPDRDDLNPNFGDDDNILSGLDELNEKVAQLSEGIDKIIEGLGCGFGGGACLALPMNRAPLAPGGDPTLYGMPVGNGLQVGEGIPITSNLTGLQTSCGHSPCCLPSAWPANSQAYIPGPACGSNSAGGNLGTWSPTNAFRLYYTPTLTLGHGIAACFGGTAIVTGNSIPMGVSPIVPGGNCVVAAAPMFACDDEDENKGDPRVVGPVTYIDDGVGGGTGDGFGVINGKCENNSRNHKLLPETNQLGLNLVNDYLNYRRNGTITPNLTNFELPTGLNGDALLSIEGSNDATANIEVDLDLSSLINGDFQDVIQIKNNRVAAFPDFLMDWVTRQIEEIVTKLTDFPTLFVILPDFDSVFDTDWGDYITKGVEEAYKKGIEENEKKEQKVNNEINNLENSKRGLKCDGKDAAKCQSIDTRINSLENSKSLVSMKQYSGVSQVYEFLSSVPIINIQPEPININIPWIDKYVFEKTFTDRGNTLEQWQAEATKYSNLIDNARDCEGTEEEIEKCEEEKELNRKVYVDLSKTIGSLEQNIAILEEWKNFPEKLSSLINKKDERLEQILCNIEVISELIGGRIGKNGKRFKAWVEAFILVKAVLKSWQLLADLFIDFDAECHECKNERNDLVHFELKLISFIIPKIPVIQFPKWPDIILDLHNIRLSINITIPEFRINKRPIVLPTLPELKLPDVPNVKISFPKIPTLPNFEVPELPDLPSLPKIELPDLPPPPKLPKLFGSIEAVIDILKLVSKALCIMKKSPFVPEWRAGDQIAFLTERTGYIPSMDFLDVTMPQFSYPFVDAIKVTTRVNFEQDVDFLTEMARNIVEPINSFTNNIVNLFQVDPDMFDFSELTPEDINIDLDNVIETDETSMNNKLINLAYIFSIGISKFVGTLDSQKSEVISNKDFIYRVNKTLSKEKFAGNYKYDELRKVWNDVSKMTFDKEDKIINDAINNNINKFKTLKSIINNERKKDKELLKDIKGIGTKKFDKVSLDTGNDFKSYNEALSKYNKVFLEKSLNLINGNNKQNQELKKSGKELINKVNGGLNEYKKNLLAVDVSGDSTEASTSDLNACQEANLRNIKFKYEGIYVVEDGYSYKLFDYVENLTGKEKVQPIDYDNDGDKDLLYVVDNEAFIKENLSIKDTKNYVSFNPLKIDSEDNKFLNGDGFIEAVNGFKETLTANKTINFKFLASTNPNINNYRVQFFNRVDKNLRNGDLNYIPDNLKKTIIDMISDGENVGITESSETYKISKNIAYFSYIGSTPGVKLVSHKFTDITESLNTDKIASITANKKLYSTSDNLEIYYIDEFDEKKQVSLDKYSSISFNNSIRIYKVEGGSLYIDSGIKNIVKGADILDYLHMPVLFDTELIVLDDRALTSSSHIDIKYYDDSELGIDLRKLNFYRMYDLGYKSKSYLMSLSIVNDYYYAIINSFSNGIISTKSKQVLLSPQLAADNTAPEINFNSDIRIPVYQEKIIDFSNYIFDNSGIDNIEDIIIERLNPPKYTILRSPGKIKIKFGKFDDLFKTSIVIKLVDKNGNMTQRDIGFEVYSPKPVIHTYKDTIISGLINEELTDEPINIYRIRGGVITKLHTSTLATKVYTTNGDFDFDSDFDGNLFSQNLELKDNTAKLLDVYGNTGKIKLNNIGYSYSIESGDSYPIIYVKDSSGNKIYKEKIILDNIKDIYIVNDFANGSDKNALYLKLLSDKYGYFKNPDDVKLNPGVVGIYRLSDVNKTSLFSIFKDGRVTTINDNYKLEYSTYDNKYVVYKLIDKHYNREVAELLLKINNNFIIK